MVHIFPFFCGNFSPATHRERSLSGSRSLREEKTHLYRCVSEPHVGKLAGLRVAVRFFFSFSFGVNYCTISVLLLNA